MAKRIIFSVAGSGKTTYIINSLSLDRRALIVTYTENNFESVKERIIKKFGYMPDNILVFTYFKFLYNFCYKPFLSYRTKANGYNWEMPPAWTLRLKRSDRKYYIDTSGRLYHNRLAKLLDQCNMYQKVGSRIEKYFDDFFVDEIQDFAGHDFNLLLGITDINTNILFVGDFFQHTFDTSRDGAINRNLHNDLFKYCNRFEKAGFIIDTVTLEKSHRCSPNTCNFVSTNLGIRILSQRKDETRVSLITEPEEIVRIMNNDRIIKLFYKNSQKYLCYSQNWGESKGQDHFVDVCVVLNKSTYKLFTENRLEKMNEKTRNKLYVACTRARNSLLLIAEECVKDFKI